MSITRADLSLIVGSSVSSLSFDRGDAVQREIALPILGSANLAFHRVAGAQAEAAHDLRGDVDVVRTGKIVRLCAAQETEAIVEHFNRAAPHDLGTRFGADLEDGEKEVLFAQR
jgi:hypothetical protein